ncbi:hypothetical protein C3Y87_17400 [Carbonactinospora thermoautotrophica]|uniref:radical SAM protein n=1 Tax=Carbonactinospora thermoautotrophica TaxID=1469144 RepID=UPI0022708755|nr:radical SAM protein [Carbonactinospora thermoautotrophica]MCX9193151.1 hypothetical protein [Carbonactinospora thermoautotrophica]
MSDLAVIDAKTSPDASGTRQAFRRYVARVLGLLQDATTFRARGSAVRVDGFRLRGHRPDAHPVEPLVPAPPGSTLLAGQVAALLDLTVPQMGGETVWAASWTSPLGEDGMWELPEPAEERDYIFAYPLPPTGRIGTRSQLVAAVLAVVTDAVDLISDGRVVVVDEVAVDGEVAPVPTPDPRTAPDLGARQELPGSGLQPLHTVAATEPSIVTVARHWGVLAQVLDVRGPGVRRLLPLADGPVAGAGTLTSFRLRRLKDWLVESDCHPSEIYEYLARVCNVACQFCYLFGNPADLAVARGKKVITEDEMETRLRYFSPAERRTLFKAQWEINEFLVDPKLPHVLRELRRRTDKPFFFITNGSPLLPRVIDLLDEVRPVTLIVSTNTLDAPLRMQVMNERRTQTETALKCLEKLAERCIPFGVSFVATPEFPVAKLAESLEKIEPLRPAFVRVNLPGFTRDHPYQLPFDTEALWSSATREIAGLRSRFTTPIVVIPSAFEADLLYDDPHEARITGTVPGSPAARAGFRPGDLVRRVGIFDITSRAELQSLVMALTRPTRVLVRRDGRDLELELDPHAPGEYPYTGHVIGKYVMPYGLVVSPSLSTGDARLIRHAVESVGARRPWLVTSPLMVSSARAFLRRWLPDLADRIRYTVVRNDYLGGNIRVLDMATVGDIFRAIERDAHASGERPDLVLLPGTGFNREGRDITGRHWGDLERALHVPVCLLDVTTQFLF